jgi:hypothetical protein
VLGNAVIENEVIPFEIKRVYYLFDIPVFQKVGDILIKKATASFNCHFRKFDVV